MGQNECLAALEYLGGIGTVQDVAQFTNNPARYLATMYRNRLIGCIASCITQEGGRPLIYYTKD